MLTPPDAWDVTPSWVTLAWERTDLVVAATLSDDRMFFVLAFERADDEAGTPVRARLLSATDWPVTFGSFPVRGTDPEDVAVRVRTYAGAFLDAVGAILADRPVDIEAVAAAADRTVEGLRTPRLLVAYAEVLEEAWSAKRWDAFLEAAYTFESLGGAPVAPERRARAEALRPSPLSLDEGLDERERIPVCGGSRRTLAPGGAGGRGASRGGTGGLGTVGRGGTPVPPGDPAPPRRAAAGDGRGPARAIARRSSTPSRTSSWTHGRSGPATRRPTLHGCSSARR